PLSKTSSTEERPAGLRVFVPLKITSCMDSPRSSEALDSPRTQRTASMMLDLPQPLGPTTPTSWPGTSNAGGSTNDLKPASLICFSRKLECPRGKAHVGVADDGDSPARDEKPPRRPGENPRRWPGRKPPGRMDEKPSWRPGDPPRQ